MSIANKILSIKEHIEDVYKILAVSDSQVYLLPNEYTQVDCIKMTGLQYIDALTTGNQNMKFEFSIKPDVLNGVKALLGDISDKDNAMSFNIANSSGAITRWGNDSKTASSGMKVNIKYLITVSKNGYYINDSLWWAPIDNEFETPLNILLFSTHGSSSTGRFSGECYYCKIWDNDVLIRNFIPCYRNEDNEVGLYDLVENKFYTNQGTNSFTYNFIEQNKKINWNIINIYNCLIERLKYYLVNGLDIVWNNWEKVSDSGSSFTLNNTAQAPMKIDLKGNTYQYSTTGKNLANIYNIADFSGSAFKRKIENDTITIWDNTNTSGYSTAEKKLSQICPNLQVGDSAKLTFTTTYQTKYIYLSGKNITWSSGSIKTIDQDMLDSIVAFYGGYQTTTVISEFMIRLSSITDDTYEPYTNGVSPNPDYPQDIQVVNGDNEIKIEGKNLLDFSLLRQGGSTGIGANRLFVDSNLRLEVGSTYTVSTNLDTSVYRYALVGSRQITPNSGGFIYDSTWKTTSTFTLTVATIAYYNINISRIDNGNLVPNDISNFWFMLEKSSTATDYEPYQSQTYPIYLGVENLFDKDNAIQGYYYNASLEYVSGNAQISDYIKVKSDSDYTISYTKNDTTTTVIRINYFNGNKEIQQQITDTSTTIGYRTYTFTIPNNIEYVRFSTTTNQSYIDQNTIQLEKGSKANSYSEYGITPIELCKIGTYQDRIAKSTRKNLFDKDNATYDYTHYKNDDGVITQSSSGSGYCETYINVESNTQYTFSYNGWDITRVYYFDNNKNWISRTSAMPVNLYTFTTPDNCYYIQFQIGSSFIGERIQLEKGSQATSYEPYGKVWCKHKQIGKIVLDGSEDWLKRQDVNYQDIETFRDNDFVAGDLITNSTGFSNYFEILTSQQEKQGLRFLNANSYGYQIQILKTIASTPQELKTWLSTNNVIVYYVLATPISEEITDTTLINQLDNLKNTKSYDEQTNILQKNNDMSFIIDATALKNI